MGELERDTIVEGGPDGWIATVSRDWDLWGPNGGYLAVIALRAVDCHAPGRRPASMECHFLRTPSPGPVALETVTQRESRRAHSVRVRMSQDGQEVLTALVWTVTAGLDGLPPYAIQPPAVPGPETLSPLEELTPEARARFPFWAQLEERSLWDSEHHVRWPAVAGPAPYRMSWLRFRPSPCFDDPYLDAGRAVIAADVYPYLAGVWALDQRSMTHVAPTLSLSVSFHARRPDAEWLLMRSDSTFSGDGLLSGRTMVWAGGEALVASGMAQMLCRPV